MEARHFSKGQKHSYSFVDIKAIRTNSCQVKAAQMPGGGARRPTSQTSPSAQCIVCLEILAATYRLRSLRCKQTSRLSA
jgi:hypothetical protein